MKTKTFKVYAYIKQKSSGKDEITLTTAELCDTLSISKRTALYALTDLQKEHMIDVYTKNINLKNTRVVRLLQDRTPLSELASRLSKMKVFAPCTAATVPEDLKIAPCTAATVSDSAKSCARLSEMKVFAPCTAATVPEDLKIAPCTAATVSDNAKNAMDIKNSHFPLSELKVSVQNTAPISEIEEKNTNKNYSPYIYNIYTIYKISNGLYSSFACLSLLLSFFASFFLSSFLSIRFLNVTHDTRTQHKSSDHPICTRCPEKEKREVPPDTNKKYSNNFNSEKAGGQLVCVKKQNIAKSALTVQTVQQAGYKALVPIFERWIATHADKYPRVREINPEMSAEAFFNYFAEYDWRDKQRKPIKSFERRIATWCLNEIKYMKPARRGAVNSKTEYTEDQFKAEMTAYAKENPEIIEIFKQLNQK